MTADSTCGKCGRPLKSSQAIRLWDGKDYCRPCVDDACPKLAEYARSHETLEDTIPYDARGVLIGCVIIYGLVVGIFALFAASIGAVPVGDAIAGALCLTSLAALIQVPLIFWTAKRRRPTVRVQDGVIAVSRSRFPLKSWRDYPFPLYDCSWKLGSLGYDTWLAPVPTLLFRRVVIVILPYRELGFLSIREKVACGWDPQMRDLWVGFLTLAGIPQRHGVMARLFGAGDSQVR